MGLKEYRRKRDFSKTAEPSGKKPSAKAGGTSQAGKAGKPSAKPARCEGGSAAGAGGATFVVQKHDASHLHYDFRLEMEGVLKSWAVPKGPCLDPSQKRLAVRTEDHPLEYGDFEGVIPEDEYGGGTVMVWDTGPVEYEGSQEETARLVEDRKPLVFTLSGSKLRGGWRMVPFNTPGEKKRNWLLIKSRDEHARADDILAAEPDSAKTGRSLDEIAASGETWEDEQTKYGQ